MVNRILILIITIAVTVSCVLSWQLYHKVDKSNKLCDCEAKLKKQRKECDAISRAYHECKYGQQVPLP